LHSFDDLRRCGEFHVRDPHSYEFIVLEGKFHGWRGLEDIIPETIRVQGIGVSAVNNFVKVIGHSAPPALFL